ncbi:hypothetical protein RFI_25391 [Reticulomyxa filosa]|uniref:NOL1/NOP2/Sun domain family member 4 n=1 Tax=Reticulomyxa filosa TaxID=46433 RepID=X6MG23_RETFI|nr:hypothetical protein RFI_25391 [Reticulomyxa filosa]|eukprot:ETO11985.1 hypothetical protein RFI_25391 [Reticulomyxa filosa]
MGNFLHCQKLRMDITADAWINQEEFKKKDKEWLQVTPTTVSAKDGGCIPTYYEDQKQLKLIQQYSTVNQQKRYQIIKLSHLDLDPYYLLDAASIRVARILHVTNRTDGLYLDMCSSPGGKALVIAGGMLKDGHRYKVGVDAKDRASDHDATRNRGGREKEESEESTLSYCNYDNNTKLVCNEFSIKRIKNLKEVLRCFVPQNTLDKHLIVTNFDAKVWGLAEQSKYDAILLDVPCTGERHLLKEKKLIQQWSLQRCLENSKAQFNLLRSALQCVKIGGHVVYATCALSDVENDGVIAQVLKKYHRNYQVADLHLRPPFEKTEYGWRVLPDMSPTYSEGPLYVCKIDRHN